MVVDRKKKKKKQKISEREGREKVCCVFERKRERE